MTEEQYKEAGGMIAGASYRQGVSDFSTFMLSTTDISFENYQDMMTRFFQKTETAEFIKEMEGVAKAK